MTDECGKRKGPFFLYVQNCNCVSYCELRGE